ncbi:MAG: hypothetical protein PVG27_07895 [Chloroflexota bacterium]|jgi:vacuolar-type H+-ATPase subunit H
MGSSTEASVLDALEQAEMAARERRLAVSSQAEGILATARERATAISAGAGQRVDEALDQLRRTAEAEADAAIADLERGLASRTGASPNRAGTDARVEPAVAMIVAHVLGEATSEPDGGDRA